MLVYSAVSALHPNGAAAYGSLAAGLIILTGILFLCSGLLRLGFVTQFLSRPVMEGFVFGLAIFVIVGQLPKLFGLKKGSGDTISQFVHLVAHLGSASWTTFAVGAVALVLLFTFDRVPRVPRVPGGLVVLAAGIVVSWALNLDAHGVDTVGKVPAGLPSLYGLDLSVHDLWVLLPSAAGLMLVIFSEALGAAQNFADKYGYQLDPNQDMIALGLANLDTLDITSSEAVQKLADVLGRQHVRLALAYVHAPVQDMLSHFEPAGDQGGWRVFPTLESAVSWARGSIPTDDAPEAQVGG